MNEYVINVASVNYFCQPNNSNYYRFTGCDGGNHRCALTVLPVTLTLLLFVNQIITANDQAGDQCILIDPVRWLDGNNYA